MGNFTLSAGNIYNFIKEDDEKRQKNTAVFLTGLCIT
jgi:hypothetical protein